MRGMLASVAALLVPAISFAQPTTVSDDPWSQHRGMTFEINFGFGVIDAYGSATGIEHGGLLAGGTFGIGGWLTPHAAVTLNVSPVFNETSSGTVILHTFVGPSTQYWVSPHVWLGGGIGASHATFPFPPATEFCGNGCGTTGLGFELRAGYAFDLSRFLSGEVGPDAFNISVQSNIDPTGASVFLLAGYQHL